MRATSVRSFSAIAATVTICAALVVHASEYNFYEQADKKGCASLITERGQDDCARVQRRKDEACNVATECDLDKQERTIEKYREAKEKLDRGEIADVDKERLKQTVRDLKDELDARREAASRSIPIARGCVSAREEVQTWFIGTAMPLTEQTRDAALRLRQELLDKPAAAQKKQAEARARRDANPDDSSARSDYDRATDEMRDAEKMLEQFNNKYGKDIERYAAKLIDHYKAEKESHERPLTESRGRVEKCERLERLSY